MPRAYYLRTAIGKTFARKADSAAAGRRWSKFIADRDLVSGAATNWDVVPEIQIPLSKRMHILGNVGFRIPANNTADRQKQVMFYVLWDWVDGGLTAGLVSEARDVQDRSVPFFLLAFASWLRAPMPRAR